VRYVFVMLSYITNEVESDLGRTISLTAFGGADEVRAVLSVADDDLVEEEDEEEVDDDVADEEEEELDDLDDSKCFERNPEPGAEVLI
jgi:hypothetical protein